MRYGGMVAWRAHASEGAGREGRKGFRQGKGRGRSGLSYVVKHEVISLANAGLPAWVEGGRPGGAAQFDSRREKCISWLNTPDIPSDISNLVALVYTPQLTRKAQGEDSGF